MTTEELFIKIKAALEDKNKLPDILDYGIATNHPVPIRTYEFNLKSNLDYGGSEGIYLDLWIDYYEDGERHTDSLGTFKTLKRDDETMYTMARLLTDFIVEKSAYVNANLDDFTWEGADVRAFDDNGNRLNWCYFCCNMKAALKRKDELLEKYQQVVVRDNATRKETEQYRHVLEIELQFSLQLNCNADAHKISFQLILALASLAKLHREQF